jgi:hypothetical protein
MKEKMFAQDVKRQDTKMKERMKAPFAHLFFIFFVPPRDRNP